MIDDFMTFTRTHKPLFGVTAIFFLGLFYLVFLQLRIPDDIFFSGDSGLKAMLSQNMIAGSLRFDLSLSDVPWVIELWDKGLFPYAAPFVYRLAEKYYITFPYTFSLVTAPFYLLWGYRGLYLIPFLATIFIWIIFYLFCIKLKIRQPVIAGGLFVLIFTTNLSLYSAMYWEHTLAVCLSFAGLYLAFPARDERTITVKAALGAGVFTGLAVWFRPEQILLVIALSAMGLWEAARRTWGGRFRHFPGLGDAPAALGYRIWAYLIASLVTLLLFGLSNWLVYHNFFGIHAIQVLEHQTLSRRIAAFVNNLILLTVDRPSLFVHIPVVLFSLGYLFLSLIKPSLAKYNRDWTPFYLFCLVFLLGVCAMVPDGAGGKQWGPRFLLFLAPVIVLLSTWQFDQMWNSGTLHGRAPAQWVGLALALALCVAGLAQNLFRGTDYLVQTYAEIKKVADVLRVDSQAVIAVSDQYLSQMFQPPLGQDMVFFRVIDRQKLTFLIEGLGAQRQDRFTYMCYTIDCDLLAEFENQAQFELNGVQHRLSIFQRRVYGKYTILDIVVTREN